MKKISSIAVLACCCTVAPWSALSAIRDIFKIEQPCFAHYPLDKVNIDDLSFVGAIVLKNATEHSEVSIGFVGDPFGNVHILSVGENLGERQAKVVKILNDQIVVSRGVNFVTIN